MQAKYIKFFFVLFLFAVINPSSLPAATPQRITLVIGNSAYSSGPHEESSLGQEVGQGANLYS